MKKLRLTPFIAAAAIAMSGCARSSNTVAEDGDPVIDLSESAEMDNGEMEDKSDSPDSIVVNMKGLYPEGIDYDTKNDRFLITSLTQGQVGAVDWEGNYSVLVKDDQVISAIGIYIDEERDRILVATSDPGASPNSTEETKRKQAHLAIYDLETGEREALVDLDASGGGQMHFANDITVDGSGNIYVTNSFSPIIYKVDLENKVKILANNEIWSAKEGQFGLNGIVWHPGGYLVVAHSAAGKLFRLNPDRPLEILEIKTDQPLPKGLDGLEITQNGGLAVVSNAKGKVMLLEGTDNWEKAKVKSEFEVGKVFPTTAAAVDGDLYVLEAHLGKLFGGNANHENFVIRRVDFK